MAERWKPIIVRCLEELGAILKPYLAEPFLLLFLMAAAGLAMLGLLWLVFRRKAGPYYPYALQEPAPVPERVVRLEQAIHDIQKKLNVLTDVYREKADELKEHVSVMREAFKLFEKHQRDEKEIEDEEFSQAIQDIAAMKNTLEELMRVSAKQRPVKLLVKEEPCPQRAEEVPAPAPEEEAPPVNRIAYTAHLTNACHSNNAAKQAKQSLTRSNREFFFERLRAPVHYHLVKQAD